MSTLEIVLLAATLVTVTTVFIVAGVLSGNRSHRQRIDEVCKEHSLQYLGTRSDPAQYCRIPVGVTVFKNAKGKYVYMDIYEDSSPSEAYWLYSSVCVAAIQNYQKSDML